jgi:hypothetical protein
METARSIEGLINMVVVSRSTGDERVVEGFATGGALVTLVHSKAERRVCLEPMKSIDDWYFSKIMD